MTHISGSEAKWGHLLDKATTSTQVDEVKTNLPLISCCELSMLSE